MVCVCECVRASLNVVLSLSCEPCSVFSTPSGANMHPITAHTISLLQEAESREGKEKLRFISSHFCFQSYGAQPSGQCSVECCSHLISYPLQLIATLSHLCFSLYQITSFFAYFHLSVLCYSSLAAAFFILNCIMFVWCA